MQPITKEERKALTEIYKKYGDSTDFGALCHFIEKNIKLYRQGWRIQLVGAGFPVWQPPELLKNKDESGN